MRSKDVIFASAGAALLAVVMVLLAERVSTRHQRISRRQRRGQRR